MKTCWGYFANLRDKSGSRSASVVMMQPTEHWNCDDLAVRVYFRNHSGRGYRNGTRNTLMRSSHVEVGNIRLEHAVQVKLVQNEYVIQAFAANASHKALTYGIRFGCADGGA